MLKLDGQIPKRHDESSCALDQQQVAAPGNNLYTLKEILDGRRSRARRDQRRQWLGIVKWIYLIEAEFGILESGEVPNVRAAPGAKRFHRERVDSLPPQSVQQNACSDGLPNARAGAGYKDDTSHVSRKVATYHAMP
jgi:hypothetical protein